MPALNCEEHTTADSVRKAADAAGINSTMPAAGASGDNFFAQLWSTIGSAYQAVGALFSSSSSHSTMSQG